MEELSILPPGSLQVCWGPTKGKGVIRMQHAPLQLHCGYAQCAEPSDSRRVSPALTRPAL